VILTLHSGILPPPLKKLSDNDFPGLKLYFDTLEMDNYPQVITWFENDILNPASLNDSVYSLIDLENT